MWLGEAEMELTILLTVGLACFSFQLLKLQMSPALLSLLEAWTRSWLLEFNLPKPALKVREAGFFPLNKREEFDGIFFQWFWRLQYFYRNICSFKLLLRSLFRQRPRASWGLKKNELWQTALAVLGHFLPEPLPTRQTSWLYFVFSSFWENSRCEPRIP